MKHMTGFILKYIEIIYIPSFKSNLERKPFDVVGWYCVKSGIELRPILDTDFSGGESRANGSRDFLPLHRLLYNKG